MLNAGRIFLGRSHTESDSHRVQHRRLSPSGDGGERETLLQKFYAFLKLNVICANPELNCDLRSRHATKNWLKFNEPQLCWPSIFVGHSKWLHLHPVRFSRCQLDLPCLICGILLSLFVCNDDFFFCFLFCFVYASKTLFLWFLENGARHVSLQAKDTSSYWPQNDSGI